MGERGRPRKGPREYMLSDMIYIAKFFEMDGAYMVARSIRKSAAFVYAEYARLKESGELERIRKLDFPENCKW